MEEMYVSPEIYFSEAAAKQYDKSSRMRKIQREMTERALELLGLEKGRVLDVGCGTGFGLAVLKERGFETAGVDIAKPMLEIAKKKGFDVVKADFRSLPFDDESFDGIISISALQWIWGKSYHEVVEGYNRAAREFYRVLCSGGRAVVQFYPKTEEEFELMLKSFRAAGFSKIDVAVDWPHVPKRTKKYIILQK